MQKVLITGATSGIGYATLKELVKDYEVIFTNYHNEKKAKELEENLNIKGYYLDLNDKESIEELAKHIESLDILINNAAISLDNSFEEPVVKEVENVEPEPLQQEQIITVSPLLFSAINYKSKQADAVEKIDEHVNEYVLSSSKTISDNVQTKQKTN